jgi:hypothetical protein
MPHWEVVEIMENYSRDRASTILGYADAVALGSGTISDNHERENLIRDYQDKAKPTRKDKREKKQEKDKPWTLGLMNF